MHRIHQLNGSMHWFDEKYGASCRATPVLVHPSRVFEHAATPHPDTRVVTKEQLEKFVAALRAFAAGIAQLPKYGTAKDVANLLSGHGLVAREFAERYGKSFQTK